MNVRRLLSRTARLSRDHYPFREPDRAPDWCHSRVWRRLLRRAAPRMGSGRLVKQPYDVQKTLQLFEQNNRLYATAARS